MEKKTANKFARSCVYQFYPGVSPPPPLCVSRSFTWPSPFPPLGRLGTDVCLSPSHALPYLKNRWADKKSISGTVALFCRGEVTRQRAVVCGSDPMVILMEGD